MAIFNSILPIVIQCHRLSTQIDFKEVSHGIRDPKNGPIKRSPVEAKKNRNNLLTRESPDYFNGKRKRKEEFCLCLICLIFQSMQNIWYLSKRKLFRDHSTSIEGLCLIGKITVSRNLIVNKIWYIVHRGSIFVANHH